MTTMRLNSKVRKFDGFTPGQRAFAGTPKMPIGAVVAPNFEDFVNPMDAPTAKTHHLLGIIHQIRKASPTADFIGKLNFGFK